MGLELQRFWDGVKWKNDVMLATEAGGRVTMRTVSPVYYEDKVLIFTGAESLKYKQLRENPNCCFSIDGFYAEAVAEFCGPTMDDGNEPLRKAYAEKFPDAFDADVAFGGREAEFVLLKPTRIRGWVFENNMPVAPFEQVF